MSAMTHRARSIPAVGRRRSNKIALILRSERSERLEGWATDTAPAAHPKAEVTPLDSRRAEDGAPQDGVGFWVRQDTCGFAT